MEFTNPQKSCTFAPDLKTMKMEELTIIEQLSQLRITASSQIPPHEFLYTWNGTPCFAKGELVYYLPGPKMLSPQLDFDGLHGAP